MAGLSGVPSGVKIEGAAQLRRTLKAAGVDMKDWSAVNRKVANVVAAVARTTAPKGPEVRGHIAVTVRPGATQRAAIVRVGNKSKPYGPAIHWGWVRRNIKPNAWVSRAAQSTEPQWTNMYFTGLEAIVNKIEGK